MAVKSYQELVVWQKAMDLVVSVYALTRNFPREEVYGLTNQLRRAAVSVPSNIAEGQGRASRPDFLRRLSIAYGSLNEVETQLLLAKRLGYLDGAATIEVLNQTSEVGRLLNGLVNSLNRTNVADH